MTFTTLTFVVFMLVVLGLVRVVRGRPRLLLLLVASYVFYGAWDWRFLGLVLLSTVVDHVVATRMARTEDERRRRLLLVVSVVVNLGVLATFKYAGFFVESLSATLASLGASADLPTLRLVVPVGISFYTFQTLAYTIDVYRRHLQPERDPLVFALYVAWFPQLVAGPIERAGRLLPQLRDAATHRLGRADWTAAWPLLVRGFVRKVVVADGVAPVVDAVFAQPGQQHAVALLVGVLAFALQIYGDFAGYSDIARGTSRLFGVELVLNFRQPYASRSITEFWRRWHISLSNWLRDYLYVPLGGNRGSRTATQRNLLLTMLLGGLWHGAAWTFVVWGAWHGLLLATHRALSRRQGHRPLPALLAVPGTFVLVSLGWVVFRASSMAEAWAVVGGIVTLQGGPVRPVSAAVVLALGLLAAGIDVVEARTPPPVGTAGVVDGAVAPPAADPRRRVVGGLVLRPLLLGCAAVLLLVFTAAEPQPFIYFQF